MLSQLRPKKLRLKRETKVGSVVVGVCYRLPDEKEVCDIFQAVGRSVILAGPGLIGRLEPP